MKGDGRRDKQWAKGELHANQHNKVLLMNKNSGNKGRNKKKGLV